MNQREAKLTHELATFGGNDSDLQMATGGAKYPDTARGRIRAHLDDPANPLRPADLEELLRENIQLKRKLEWPAEQPQDADIQVARAWLAELSENIRSYHQSIPGQPGCTCGRSLACGNDVPDYAAIWTLEAALDAWVPTEEDEQPQDERDGDANFGALSMLLTRDRGVLARSEEAAIRSLLAQQDGDARAVAALQNALAAGGRGWAEMGALVARFADRIAELDARDAEAER